MLDRLNGEGAKMRANTCVEFKSVRVVSVLVALSLTASTLLAAPPSNARPFRVVDRNGALVGYTVTENLVAREIGPNWVTFYLHTGLGIFDSNAIYLYFTTADCSGPSYIPHYSTFAEGTRVGPKLYYPLDSQVLNPQSSRVVNGAGEQGQCFQTSDVNGVYGVATAVNVDSFNLQLPFRALQ